MTLPSAKDLADTLYQAETKNELLKIKSTFVPIMQCIRPDIYGECRFTEFSTIRSQLNASQPLVMMSGGIGSVSALWRVLTFSRGETTF